MPPTTGRTGEPADQPPSVTTSMRPPSATRRTPAPALGGIHPDRLAAHGGRPDLRPTVAAGDVERLFAEPHRMFLHVLGDRAGHTGAEDEPIGAVFVVEQTADRRGRNSVVVDGKRHVTPFVRSFVVPKVIRVFAALGEVVVHAEIFCPFHDPGDRAADVLELSQSIVHQDGAPFDGAPDAAVDPAAEFEDAARLRAAPTHIGVVQAWRVGHEEVEGADGGKRLDLLVDRAGHGVVDHAQGHGVGIGDPFQVAELLLAEHAVLGAAGLDRLDEIACRRQQLRQRLAGDPLPPLVVGQLLRGCPSACTTRPSDPGLPGS